MPANHVFNFFFKQGDADHDGNVDLDDYNILAGNFNTSGNTFSDGDFDYDGTVELDDFDILASNFGTSLAGVRPRTAAPSGARIIESLQDDLLA
jgi:hypothetical protein